MALTIPCSALRSAAGSKAALLGQTALAGLIVLLPVFAAAQDLPTGSSVVSGDVTVETPSSSSMAITQGSDTAVVNWQSFSIGDGARVDITQPSANSAILNRVTGDATSEIHGQLNANGQVFVVNPNGIYIGPNGEVSAGGGFVGSTLDITNEDFSARRLTFNGDGNSAQVRNDGDITVGAGGFAALLGGQITNNGTVTVPLGRVGFGAGERATLDLSGDGFLQVAVPSTGNDDETQALIENAGSVSAAGGRIEMRAATARNAARQAINMSGVAEASSVSVRDGVIVLGGGDGGRVTVSGRASTRAAPKASFTKWNNHPAVKKSVRPAARPGSEITITGAQIVLDGADIDASGYISGGTVRIGGDFGGGIGFQTAETVTVDAASVVRSDGLDTGNGGRVAVWSDLATTFEGNISARGGDTGGDGGFVEVSSAQDLTYAGLTDLRAPNGAFGTLLLDPTDFTIVPDDEGLGGPNVLLESDVEMQLSMGDFVLNTDSGLSDNGDILVRAQIDWSEATAFQLIADGDVEIQRSLIGPDGTIEVTAAGAIAIGDFDFGTPITIEAVSADFFATGTNTMLGETDGGVAIVGPVNWVPHVVGGEMQLNGMGGVLVAGALTSEDGSFVIDGNQNTTYGVRVGAAVPTDMGFVTSDGEVSTTNGSITISGNEIRVGEGSVVGTLGVGEGGALLESDGDTWIDTDQVWMSSGDVTINTGGDLTVNTNLQSMGGSLTVVSDGSAVFNGTELRFPGGIIDVTAGIASGGDIDIQPFLTGSETERPDFTIEADEALFTAGGYFELNADLEAPTLGLFEVTALSAGFEGSMNLGMGEIDVETGVFVLLDSLGFSEENLDGPIEITASDASFVATGGVDPEMGFFEGIAGVRGEVAYNSDGTFALESAGTTIIIGDLSSADGDLVLVGDGSVTVGPFTSTGVVIGGTLTDGEDAITGPGRVASTNGAIDISGTEVTIGAAGQTGILGVGSGGATINSVHSVNINTDQAWMDGDLSVTTTSDGGTIFLNSAISTASGDLSFSAGRNVEIASSQLSTSDGTLSIASGTAEPEGEVRFGGREPAAPTVASVMLQADSATVTSNDDIDVNADIAWMPNAAGGTLAFNAGNSVEIRSDISSTSGSFDFTASVNLDVGDLEPGDGATVFFPGSVTTVDGDIALTTSEFDVSINDASTVQTSTGSITITAADDFDLNSNGTLSNGSGQTVITAQDQAFVATAGTLNVGVGGTTISGGDVVLNGPVIWTNAGDLTVNADRDVTVTNTLSSSDGDLTITALDDVFFQSIANLNFPNGSIAVNAGREVPDGRDGIIRFGVSGGSDQPTIGITAEAASFTTVSDRINVDTNVVWTPTGSAPLTFNAGNDLDLRAVVSSTTGSFDFTAGDELEVGEVFNSGTEYRPGGIVTDSGTITLTAVDDVEIRPDSEVSTTTGNITVVSGDDVLFYDTLESTSGDIAITAADTVLIGVNPSSSFVDSDDPALVTAVTNAQMAAGGNYAPGTVQTDGMTTITATSGDVVLSGTSTLGVGSGGTTVTAGDDIFINEAITWTSDATLALVATDDIGINAPITGVNGTLEVTSGPTTTETTTDGDITVNRMRVLGGAFVQDGAGDLANLPDLNVANGVEVADGAVFLRILGGDGSADNPFIIGDLLGLQGVGSKPSDGAYNFALGNDIDGGGQGFAPIASMGNTLSGANSDGNFTISNFTIEPTDTGAFGLFVVLQDGAVIRDLNIANVSAQGDVGGVIAAVTLPGSTVENVTVGGMEGSDDMSSVTNRSGSDVAVLGGAFGVTLGDVRSVASNVDVTIDTTGDMLTSTSAVTAGGLTAIGVGTTDQSSSTGDLTVTLDEPSDNVLDFGGLIGGNDLAAFRIAVENAVGNGFMLPSVGSDDGSITNAFSRGDVSITATNDFVWVGGLSGFWQGSVEDSFAASPITVNNSGGGTIGALIGSGSSVTGSFFDQTVAAASMANGAPVTDDVGTGLTTSELQSPLFVNTGFAAGWNFDTIWSPGSGATYPELEGAGIVSAGETIPEPIEPDISLAAEPLPNPAEEEEADAVAGEGDDADAIAAAAAAAQQTVAQATAVQAQVTNFSAQLANSVSAANCGTGAGVDVYLSCLSDGLADFATQLDSISTDLPPGLQNVARIVQDARVEIEAIRQTAQTAVAAAATPAAQQQVAQQATQQAAAVLNTAAQEVRASAELQTTTDPDVAAIQAQTTETVAAALETAGTELVEVTQL